MTQQPKTNPQIGLSILMALMFAALGFQSWAILTQWGGPERQVFLGDTLNLFPNFFGAILIGWVAWLHQGETRRAWAWIALALFTYFVADAVWAYLELVLESDPFPSVADIFYVAFPIFLGIGLWQFPKSKITRLESLKLSVDVVVIVAAAFVFYWYAFLVQTIEEYGSQWVALGVSLFYPVADLALLALILLLAVRQTAHLSNQLILGLGITLLILADTLYNVQSATDSYVSGTLLDSVWVWSSAVFAFAAFSSLRSTPQPTIRQIALHPIRSRILSNLAPYSSILLCFYLVYISRSSVGLTPAGVLLGTGLVTLLVLLRQAIAFAENHRLTQELQSLNYQLESRVQERMRELAEQREQLLASEKLASLGRLTAGIAHEINTPLAASMNHLLQARKLAEEYKDSIGVKEVTEADHLEIATELGHTLQQTNASLERMGEFIRKMRSQSRNPEGAVAGFDPVRVARETLALLENQALEAGVRLELQAPSQPLTLHGEAGRFSQVLSNLIQNAIHACENRSDGQISRVKIGFEQDLKYLLVRVSDNGSGIAPEVLPKIFDPLFTTKPVGKGTGLGLPIIRDIVKGHFGGDITLETELGQGSTFTASFPLKTTQPSKPPAEPEKILA